MVFKGTTGMCESICLQMKRDRVMCTFEMDFKKSFCRRSNVSNDDIISYRPLACEQTLLFLRSSRERASEGPLPLAASPLARAFSRDSLRSPK